MKKKETANYYCEIIKKKIVGTKFRGLTTLDMLVDTWIRGFQIIHLYAILLK